MSKSKFKVEKTKTETAKLNCSNCTKRIFVIARILGVCTMSGKEDDVGVVEKVKEYFLEAEDFEATFMKWAKDHCDEVELEEGEMKLV